VVKLHLYPSKKKYKHVISTVGSIGFVVFDEQPLKNFTYGVFDTTKTLKKIELVSYIRTRDYCVEKTMSLWCGSQRSLKATSLQLCKEKKQTRPGLVILLLWKDIPM